MMWRQFQGNNTKYRGSKDTSIFLKMMAGGQIQAFQETDKW